MEPIKTTCSKKNKEGDQIDSKRQCENRGREWCDAVTSQEMPPATRSWQRQAMNTQSCGASEAFVTPLFWLSETDFGLLASKTMKE